VTAEPEVNIGSSRRGPIMTLSETPSKEQHENGTTYHSPINRPVDPKQIATEIINTPAFSL
jgi:hypothetical protein